MLYDVLVSWYTGYHRNRLTPAGKWHRGVRANSLLEACDIALSRHRDQWMPSVSMCWPQWPQPKG